MIGQVLWLEFFSNRDWPVASALAVMLLVLLLTPIMIYRQREVAAAGESVDGCGSLAPSISPR